MVNMCVINIQYVYLSISLISFCCIINNFYIIPCSNIVGIICIIDFYFVKKKDMLLHHIFVLGMLHYINNHNTIEYRENLVTIVLKTEISTIFLITKNLLDTSNNIIFKNINNIAFIITFFYYRIYNYGYYLILNKHINTIIHNYSKNNFEYLEIYLCIYGLFILNLYWLSLIFNKLKEKMYKK